MSRQSIPNYNSNNNHTNNASEIDFDEEGRRLQQRSQPAPLNPTQPSVLRSSRYRDMDAIYVHPVTGASIYVGNCTAAESYLTLCQHKVTRVVNCTSGVSKIPDFHSDKMAYLEFPISSWNRVTNATNASIIAFVKPLFSFIDEALENGESVLVHCLAGAHRAGTTGCACLIYYEKLDVSSAITVAKQRRPFIDPIGHLPDFLRRLEKALNHTTTHESDA